MNAFIAGIIFGGLFVASGFVLFMGRSRRPKRREPIEWHEDYFDNSPPVVTHVTHQSINRIREIKL